TLDQVGLLPPNPFLSIVKSSTPRLSSWITNLTHHTCQFGNAAGNRTTDRERPGSHVAAQHENPPLCPHHAQQHLSVEPNYNVIYIQSLDLDQDKGNKHSDGESDSSDGDDGNGNNMTTLLANLKCDDLIAYITAHASVTGDLSLYGSARTSIGTGQRGLEWGGSDYDRYICCRTTTYHGLVRHQHVTWLLGFGLARRCTFLPSRASYAHIITPSFSIYSFPTYPHHAAMDTNANIDPSRKLLAHWHHFAPCVPVPRAPFVPHCSMIASATPPIIMRARMGLSPILSQFGSCVTRVRRQCNHSDDGNEAAVTMATRAPRQSQRQQRGGGGRQGSHDDGDGVTTGTSTILFLVLASGLAFSQRTLAQQSHVTMAMTPLLRQLNRLLYGTTMAATPLASIPLRVKGNPPSTRLTRSHLYPTRDRGQQSGLLSGTDLGQTRSCFALEGVSSHNSTVAAAPAGDLPQHYGVNTLTWDQGVIFDQSGNIGRQRREYSTVQQAASTPDRHPVPSYMPVGACNGMVAAPGYGGLENYRSFFSQASPATEASLWTPSPVGWWPESWGNPVHDLGVHGLPPPPFPILPQDTIRCDDNVAVLEDLTTHQRKPKVARMASLLSIVQRLQALKFTVIDLLVCVIDGQGEFEGFRNALFSPRNRNALTRLFNKFYHNDKGRTIFTDWMLPHSVTLVQETIHAEMEAAKPHLRMHTKEVTPNFIEEWDIHRIMEPIIHK
ncbi:hypothetical protein EDB84DRAFT_1439715, partial [Lactarius hengduanensis]